MFSLPQNLPEDRRMIYNKYCIQYDNFAAVEVVIVHISVYTSILLLNTDNCMLVTADFISCFVSLPVYNALGYTERDLFMLSIYFHLPFIGILFVN